MPCHERLHEIFALMILFWLHDPCKVSKVVIIAAREMWRCMDTGHSVWNGQPQDSSSWWCSRGLWALQRPGDGIAGRLNAGREEKPKLARQEVVGQGLVAEGVPQTQQMCCYADVTSAGLPLAFTWA